MTLLLADGQEARLRYRNRALHCLTANQSAGCLLEQGENALRQLVGLGQHGGAGLLQDLTTGQGGGFRCKIGVLDPAARCREIFRGGLQVADGALEAVLQSTVLARWLFTDAKAESTMAKASCELS
jgi:hypothetical protein